jgi:hypothetical protein
VPFRSVNPTIHVRNERTINYESVKTGYICCMECSREWKLIPVFSGGARWVNSCEVFMPGAIRTDWWAFHKLPKIEPPTEEEILASRALRLDMLDKKAREHAQALQDSMWGFDWLQKERGYGGKFDQERFLEMLAGTKKRPQHKLRMTIRFPSIQDALVFLRIMRQWRQG